MQRQKYLASGLSLNVKTVRLMADGCGGQNKNSLLITMVSKCLSINAPVHVNTVEVICPVTGHSYTPSDRVFARIEKVIRKVDTIVDSNDYEKIFSDHCTLFELSSDLVPVYDW